MSKLLIVLLFCYSFTTHADHFVSVVPVKMVEASPKMKLRAIVDEKIDNSKVSSIHNYRLTVKLPKNVVPTVTVGENVNVILPVIHNRVVSAKITEINNNEIKLILSNQVQQLEGQILTTEIPLKTDGLFLIPSQAIYSPRGINPLVFILEANDIVKTIPVEVLQVLDKGQMLVSSHELANAQVVFRGLNNLISGDQVKIVKNQETNK